MGKEQDLKQFLKEKGLSREFARFKKIKKLRKTRVPVLFSNYDGTNRASELILTKEKGKTIIRDKDSFTIVGRSSKSVRAVRTELQTRQRQAIDLKSSRGWTLKSNIKHSAIPIKNESKYISRNNVIDRNTEVKLTNKSPKGKFGFVIVDVTVIGMKNEKKRVQARSSGPSPLWNKIERSKRIDEALINATAVAGFSPSEIIIHDIFFEYRRTIKTKGSYI